MKMSRFLFWFFVLTCFIFSIIINALVRGGGTGEASEVRASPEFRGFSTEKFLTSWIYEGGNFSCFTGKKLVPTSLVVFN